MAKPCFSCDISPEPGTGEVCLSYCDVYDDWRGNEIKISYAEYIKSDEWRLKANNAKARAGSRCQICNSGGELHAHHRTYERLGKEIPSDITVLCSDCHGIFHDRTDREVGSLYAYANLVRNG